MYIWNIKCSSGNENENCFFLNPCAVDNYKVDTKKLSLKIRTLTLNYFNQNAKSCIMLCRLYGSSYYGKIIL